MSNGSKPSLERNSLRGFLLLGILAVRAHFACDFFCNGRFLGETGLTVVLPLDRVKRAVRKFRWVLSYGPPIYKDQSFFQVPIKVSAEEQRGSTYRPSVVDRDIRLKVVEQNGQLPNIDPLVIPKNTGISDPVYLPFPVGANYRLVAYELVHGQPTNELGISWTDLKPKLTLVANPTSVSLYSSAISSANVRLYLALDGRQIKPHEKMEILLDAPATMTFDRSARAYLTPDEPIANYSVSAATTTGNWPVSFQQPQIGSMAAAQIRVLPTLGFSVCAVVAGLVGIVVTRRQGLFKQSFWAVTLEILCAGVAAFLLHGMVLARWIKIPAAAAAFFLGYLAAVLVGLIGGHLGVGVFKLGKKLFAL